MRRAALTPALVAAAAVVAAEPIPFDASHWNLESATVTEVAGRQALSGLATLKDVAFENGVVEVDVLMRSRARSYPGVLFRTAGNDDYERVYLRPHRSPLYSDAVQYVGCFNGIDSWQLYNGPGFTAQAAIPSDEWVHLKIEVAGRQARVTVGPSTAPVLRIPSLRHGSRRGGLGLMAVPANGNACFSGFSFHEDPGLDLGPEAPELTPPGILADWEVSTPLLARELERDAVPPLAGLEWRRLQPSPDGIVDVSRLHGRVAEPQTVLARATLASEREEVRRFNLGYSDAVTVFCNGRPVFSGQSAYGSRDPSFLGVVGLADAVYLPLRRGSNELLLALTEVTGGWGFILQDASATRQVGLEKVFETPPRLPVPESAVYDSARDAFYVSAFDGFNPSGPEGRQALARVRPDGSLESARWVTGLRNPTGLALAGDTLYAVEADGVAVVDVPTASVTGRLKAAGARRLNDVALGPAHQVFASDPAAATIFARSGEALVPWLADPALAGANGLLVQGGRLLVVTNGDSTLKAVDLASQTITTLANLAGGTLDGIASDGVGNVLVSHWEGRVLRVSPDGRVETVLDTTALDRNAADIAVDANRGLLLVPTFLDGRLTVYRLTARQRT